MGWKVKVSFKKGDLVRHKDFPGSIGILVVPGSVVVDKVIFPKVQWLVYPAGNSYLKGITYSFPDSLDRIITDEVW